MLYNKIDLEDQDLEDHHLDCSIKPGEPEEGVLEPFATCSQRM